MSTQSFVHKIAFPGPPPPQKSVLLRMFCKFCTFFPHLGPFPEGGRVNRILRTKHFMDIRTFLISRRPENVLSTKPGFPDTSGEKNGFLRIYLQFPQFPHKGPLPEGEGWQPKFCGHLDVSKELCFPFSRWCSLPPFCFLSLAAREDRLSCRSTKFQAVILYVPPTHSWPQGILQGRRGIVLGSSVSLACFSRSLSHPKTALSHLHFQPEEFPSWPKLLQNNSLKQLFL